MNIKKILLLSTMYACLLPVFGQQRAYSLDECIEAALKNNARIKNAENELKMAREDKKEAFTKYFPNISAAGTGFLASEPLVQMQMSPEAGMSMLKDGWAGGISAVLPVFTGGQLVNGNKLAKTAVEVKQLQKNMADDEVCLTTEKYFWQVVMLKEKLETLVAVEKQLDRIMMDVQASLEAGLVTRNDLLQVQLRKNETQSGRIELENALSMSRSLLRQYIGVGADSIDVNFRVEETLPDCPESYYCDHAAALPGTDQYGMLQQNVAAARLQYKLAVGKNLPTIAIGGGYVYDNFIMGQDQSFCVGFATVTVPISGWWGGSHTLKKHKLQVKNAEILLNDNKDLLIIQMQHAWDSLNEAYKQAEIAHLSIEQSAENLRLKYRLLQGGHCYHE